MIEKLNSGNFKLTRKTVADLKRNYSWKPDIPDFRDYLLSAPKGVKLPSKVDLRSFMTPVENQSYLGSCVANAVVGGMEYLENKKTGKKSFTDLSRLFVYYQTRVLEGTVYIDAGCQIRNAIKVITKTGACKESIWPYDISKFSKRPTANTFTDASQRKLIRYERCVGLDAIKLSLSNGYPVVFGFAVYSGFINPSVSSTGKLNMPRRNEAFLGGHAVLCVGYDDAQQRIIVRNSWGNNWGDKGYFTMPYEYISNPNLADDIWSLQQ